MKTFTELKVWQKAHQFVLAIYRTTASFPTHERFGLVAQMRRASVSVAANIAEGHQRRYRTEFSRFLSIALGSLEETRYYLLLSTDLGFQPCAALGHCLELADEIGRMLEGLRKHIRRETT